MLVILWTLAETTEVPPWMQAGGFMSLISLFAWWVWHTTSVGIPKMHQEQRTHVEQITKIHADTTATLVEEFRAESKEQRVACAEATKALWEHIKLKEGTRNPNRNG
jgi:ABC-type nickel/cobalt efflux system permease component RcnA